MNKDVFLEVTHSVEHLDAIALAVTHINRAVAPDGNAMDDLHKHAAQTGFHFAARALTSPLTQKLSIFVKHCYSGIAVAIGDIDVIRSRIYRNCGWHEEPILAGIESSPSN
jgi:hypothetical protein